MENTELHQWLEQKIVGLGGLSIEARGYISRVVAMADAQMIWELFGDELRREGWMNPPPGEGDQSHAQEG